MKKERKRERVNGEGRNAEVEKENERKSTSLSYQPGIPPILRDTCEPAEKSTRRNKNIDRGVGPFNFAV